MVICENPKHKQKQGGVPAPAAQRGAAYRKYAARIHRAAFAFEEEESGHEKGPFIIPAAVLALVCAAALAENTTLTAVELNVDSLEYVDESRCLIARDADTRLYGLYSTAGEAMIPCEYGLLADAGYGFFEAINDDGLNSHALLRESGEAVTGWEYAAFEVLNERWGLAVTLEPTESEDYDYSGGFLGGGEHYVVTAYDVYDLEAAESRHPLARGM